MRVTDKRIELLPPQLNARKIRLDGIFTRDKSGAQDSADCCCMGNAVYVQMVFFGTDTNRSCETFVKSGIHDVVSLSVHDVARPDKYPP